jgi:hypothetical protein
MSIKVFWMSWSVSLKTLKFSKKIIRLETPATFDTGYPDTGYPTLATHKADTGYPDSGYLLFATH